jgi:hypothetical protein
MGAAVQLSSHCSSEGMREKINENTLKDPGFSPQSWQKRTLFSKCACFIGKKFSAQKIVF